MFIDTHTHLYHQRFDDDRVEMVNRALDSGVERLYLPNIDADSIDSMGAMVKQWPNVCFQMMGLHPCSVEKDSQAVLQRMRELLDSGNYIAVGEIGIDLYWDKSLLTEQQDAFRLQVRWAKELGLPIVIHCRESFQEVFAIVAEENAEELTGVFHCFTGTPQEAEMVKSLGGFYLGIGGVVTFKNGGLAESLPEIGLAHCVLETDSPFLAPVPNRGKRNESSYVPLIAEKVAEVLGVSVEEVGRVTSSNANQLFGYER
jgi:TatD DNase family protein